MTTAHAAVARDQHVSRYHVGKGARFSRPLTPWWPVELERGPGWISLDEAAHRRNRELPTVISAPEQRRVLDVIPRRSKQAVQQWLHALPVDVAANIKVVSTDPYDAYRRASRPNMPHAVIVCDPFHLLRGAGTAMDSVRRDRQRIARTTGRLARCTPVRQTTQLATRALPLSPPAAQRPRTTRPKQRSQAAGAVRPRPKNAPSLGTQGRLLHHRPPAHPSRRRAAVRHLRSPWAKDTTLGSPMPLLW